MSSALNVAANRILCSCYPAMKIGTSHPSTPIYEKVETNVSELFILFYCFKGSICVMLDSCIWTI